jgi:HPt (histidine-containing phosphotransfer) domain-containing protein
MTEPPVLDPAVIETLRQLTPAGEPDVLSEVLQLFLQEVPPRIDRLRIAWQAGNIQEVHRAAHSLKGSAGNIGAQRLLKVCRQLDDRERPTDAAATAALVGALDVEFGMVEQEIRRLLQSKGAT